MQHQPGVFFVSGIEGHDMFILSGELGVQGGWFKKLKSKSLHVSSKVH